MRIKQIIGCEEYLYVLTDKDTIIKLESGIFKTGQEMMVEKKDGTFSVEKYKPTNPSVAIT